MSSTTLNADRHCTAKVAGTNRRCRAFAIAGGNVCVYHGGKAPQVRAAAQRRLLEAVDPALAELVKLARTADSESVRLQAVRDILDRAGLGASTKIEADVTHFDGNSQLDRAIDEMLAAMAAREAAGQ